MLLPNNVRELLEKSGQPWEIVNGAKHYKLIVGGRMATVLPHSPVYAKSNGGGRWRQVLSSIKRTIRKLEQHVD